MCNLIILIKKTIITFIVVTGVVCIVGSSSTPIKTPFFISSSFTPKVKQRVVLLPVVDHGIHESLDTEPNADKMIRKVVEERGYEFAILENVDYPDNIEEHTFNTLNFDWIKHLKLNPGDWAFIISIDYLKRSSFAGGVRADAYITGYLVEYPSGEFIWEGFGYGGLSIGWAFAALADNDALTIGIFDLMKQMPPIDKYSNIVLEEPLFKGTCKEDCDNPAAESLFCVFRKEGKKKEEFEENPGHGLTDQVFTLYDGMKIITNIDQGQYICWSRMPGKVMLNINGGSPTHFRSKGGREYYLIAKEGGYFNYKKGIFWIFNEIEMSEREIYVNKYTKIDQNTKVYDEVE